MKVFTNGNIITLSSKNKTEAMVVNQKGKIVDLGKNNILKDKYNPNINETINLEGHTVIPGLNDSHLHLYQYGLSKNKIDLSGSESIEEIKNRVKNYIKENNLSKGDWIEGKGWNDEILKENRFPNAEDLNEITTKYPIVLKRVCFHVAAVNSKALEFCEISKNTSEPEGGEIGRKKNGKPDGLFYDEAIDIIDNQIPQNSIKEIKEILKGAFTDMLKKGLTSIQVDDFFNVENPDKILKAYLELKKENNIPLRVNLQMRIPRKNKINEFNKKGFITGYGDDFFKIGPVKLVLDGSLGARTAALKDPYSDKKSTNGKALYKQEKFNEISEYAVKSDFQLAVHAIGDRAIDMALTGFENAYVNQKEAVKNRPIIVHSQICNKSLNKRMKKLGVIASIQPIFLKSDWNLIEDRVGKQRSKLSYAWKSLLDTGINISGSSDCPVEPFNPLLGIYTAVTRQDLDGNPEGGWHPEEKLTLNEALNMYTINSAYQSFEEDKKGNLVKGKLADFVILDRDITKIDSSEIKNINVIATYVGGKIQYSK